MTKFTPEHIEWWGMHVMDLWDEMHPDAKDTYRALFKGQIDTVCELAIRGLDASEDS